MDSLKRIRLLIGFTQEQMANKTNITIRNYQYIEHGKRLPRVDRAIAIAKVLNTTVEELFDSPKRQLKRVNKNIKQNNNSIKRR